MFVLGGAAFVLLVATAVMVYEDTTLRTRNSTYINIASQMQFHTQRLAKAAGLAARGTQGAFPQLQDSRDEFANYLATLQNGGIAFGVEVPPAGGSEEIKSRLEELSKRWPESANAATAILNAQKDLVALAQNIAQIRVGSEEMATLSQEFTGIMSQSGSTPGQVLRANRLTLLAERLGRGSAEILGSEVIDPEVPFLIGKDTNDTREIIRALESGSDALGITALRDNEARAKLAELKKQFAAFELNVGPILRDLQKLVTARQAGAKLFRERAAAVGVGAFRKRSRPRRNRDFRDAAFAAAGAGAAHGPVFLADSRRGATAETRTSATRKRSAAAQRDGRPGRRRPR
jgi:twitching motility protein PilJ